MRPFQFRKLTQTAAMMGSPGKPPIQAPRAPRTTSPIGLFRVQPGPMEFQLPLFRIRGPATLIGSTGAGATPGCISPLQNRERGDPNGQVPPLDHSTDDVFTGCDSFLNKIIHGAVTVDDRIRLVVEDADDVSKSRRQAPPIA